MKASKTSMYLKVHQHETLISQVLKLFVISRGGGGGSALMQMYQVLPQSIHRVATATFWRAFRHDNKISPAWWAGACTPSPFHSIYHHQQSCGVRSSWEGRYMYSPYFSCTPICTLWTLLYVILCPFFCLLSAHIIFFYTCLRHCACWEWEKNKYDFRGSPCLTTIRISRCTAFNLLCSPLLFYAGRKKVHFTENWMYPFTWWDPDWRIPCTFPLLRSAQDFSRSPAYIFYTNLNGNFRFKEQIQMTK